MLLGVGEDSCEVGNACELGALKPGVDACLEYGELAEVSFPCLEEEVVIGLS